MRTRSALNFLLATALLSLSVEPCFAKTLKCSEGPSFTNRSFTINRDGSIGFNGTFVTIDSPIGVWGKSVGESLSDLTGRSSDSKLTLKHLVLPLSPRAACTPSDTALGTDFKCEVKGATIWATGNGYRDTASPPALGEEITLTIRMKADVELEFKAATDSVQADLLSGTVTEPTSGKTVSISVPVNSAQEFCQTSDE